MQLLHNAELLLNLNITQKLIILPLTRLQKYVTVLKRVRIRNRVRINIRIYLEKLVKTY